MYGSLLRITVYYESSCIFEAFHLNVAKHCTILNPSTKQIKFFFRIDGSMQYIHIMFLQYIIKSKLIVQKKWHLQNHNTLSGNRQFLSQVWASYISLFHKLIKVSDMTLKSTSNACQILIILRSKWITRCVIMP